MSLLIVGQSALARVVTPALLRPLKHTLILASDALGAFHILERVPAEAVLVDSGLRGVDAQTFARLAAREPALARVSMHQLPACDEDEAIETLLARCERAWRQTRAESADLSALAGALATCLERALKP